MRDNSRDGVDGPTEPESPAWDAAAAAEVRAMTNRAQRRSCKHQIKGQWCVRCGTEVPS